MFSRSCTALVNNWPPCGVLVSSTACSDRGQADSHELMSCKSKFLPFTGSVFEVFAWHWGSAELMRSFLKLLHCPLQAPVKSPSAAGRLQSPKHTKVALQTWKEMVEILWILTVSSDRLEIGSVSWQIPFWFSPPMVLWESGCLWVIFLPIKTTKSTGDLVRYFVPQVWRISNWEPLNSTITQIAIVQDLSKKHYQQIYPDGFIEQPSRNLIFTHIYCLQHGYNCNEMHFLRRQGKINIFLMRILYLRNSFFSGMIRLSSFLNTETEMSLKNEALLTPRHWTYSEDKKSPTLISPSWNVIYPAQKGVTLTHFYVGVFRCCEASGTVKE